MSRIKPNESGGGANTNKNGLYFEQMTSLNTALTKAGYYIIDNEIYTEPLTQPIGMSVPQKNLYTKFLIPNGIDYKNYNSKEWHPDEAFVNYRDRTVYIIKKKFQNCPGSVDEKLPNCHFKKMEYEKLFSPLNYKVEFIYIFNDWFLKDVYRDTLQYIKYVGCHYFYNYLPLEFIGL